MRGTAMSERDGVDDGDEGCGAVVLWVLALVGVAYLLGMC